MNKKKIGGTIYFILLSLIFVLVAYIGSADSKNYYESLKLPVFAPPSWLFPIMWSILYAMIITAGAVTVYKVPQSFYKKQAIKFYFVQFAFNALWPYFFFVFKLNILSSVILVITLILAALCGLAFYKTGYYMYMLFVPYILWLLFALVLNISVAVLNA